MELIKKCCMGEHVCVHECEHKEPAQAQQDYLLYQIYGSSC